MYARACVCSVHCQFSGHTSNAGVIITLAKFYCEYRETENLSHYHCVSLKRQTDAYLFQLKNVVLIVICLLPPATMSLETQHNAIY